MKKYKNFTSFQFGSHYLNVLIISAGNKNEIHYNCQQRISIYNKNNLRITEYIVYPNDKEIHICGERFNIVFIDEQLPEEILFKGVFANLDPHATIYYNTKLI